MDKRRAIRAPTAGGKRTATGRSRRAPDAYHHGDLRNALLRATEALLSEEGVERFTLREVARRAGVSHAAPAHHFRGATGLLTAFTAESFALLAARMAARRRASAPEPFEQLVATGLAYIDFALTNRARFRLMFRSERLDAADAALEQAGAAAYAHLVDCIAAIVREASGDAATARELTSLAWSTVHGFATLMIDNRAFAAGVAGGRAKALASAEALLRRSRGSFVEGGKQQ